MRETGELVRYCLLVIFHFKKRKLQKQSRDYYKNLSEEGKEKKRGYKKQKQEHVWWEKNKKEKNTWEIAIKQERIIS